MTGRSIRAWSLLLSVGACSHGPEPATTAERGAAPAAERDAPAPKERPTAARSPKASAKPSPVPSPHVDPPKGPPGLEIGTDSPMVVVDVAPQGHWVTYCQARADTDDKAGIEVRLGRHGDTHGDALVPYLAIGGGPELVIDDYVGRDEAGRFVAVTLPGDGLVLLDTWADTKTVLHGARTDDDAMPFGHHRAAAFGGDHIAYARRVAGDRTTVVVRDLATNVETSLDPGPGALWRFDLSPGGDYVVMRVVTEDRDGDGKLTPPSSKTSLSGRRCRGPVGSFSTFGSEGDGVEVRVARVRPGAKATPTRGLLATMRSGPLLRAPTKALVIEGAPDIPVFDAACEAELVHTIPERDEVWASCRGERTSGPGHFDQAPLMRFSAGAASDTGLHVEVFDRDTTVTYQGLIHALEGKTVNATTGTIGDAIGGHGTPAHVDGDRLLYLGAKKSFVYDLATQKRSGVPGLPGGYVHVNGGDMVAILTGRRTTVVDLAGPKVLGQTRAEAAAVATNGHVLVPRRANAARMVVADGPLRWHAPK